MLALFDASRPLDNEDLEILEYLRRSSAVKIAIITKGDLISADRHNPDEGIKLPDASMFTEVVRISARKEADEAIASIKNAVTRLFTDEKISIGDDAIVASARQNASLVRAREFLKTAAEAYRLGLPQDAASSDIELSLGAISELDGRAVSEEVVSDIFARFCVGK